MRAVVYGGAVMMSTSGMPWMRMPGQTWLDTGASFLGMWILMMAAMMLPSLVPMLWRYRAAVHPTVRMNLARLTAVVGAGYFFVWTMVGLVAFALGAALMTFEMRMPTMQRLVPMAVGAVVLIAGALQFTAWKARQLAVCRGVPGHGCGLMPQTIDAWRHGLHLGLRCSYCCAGLTAMLLVLGVMDLRVMAVVTAAITLERLAPAGARVARVTGALIVGAGVFLIRQSTL